MKKVFVNGTFDIIHLGHLALLSYARSLGDSLLVGIDSDERVRNLKGPSRPIKGEYERACILAALKDVEEVCIFNTDQELVELIQECDIMVKGSDWKGKTIIGEQYCNQIEFFDRIDEYSTTNTIQDITNRR
jgi:D-beta-D-heptose 7-phosphate kinase/D-beta-D-heptose 1-phosphate adenosyltransferase